MEQTTNDDSPVWRRGNLYAVRSAGCADGFEVWHKYGNSSIPVSLGKDVTSLREMLTDLEEAGEDEAWRARTIGGSSMDGSNTNDDLNDHAVERAMRSDAERISEECDALKAMLLEKNRAYGSSALSPVRIFAKSDTVEQIRVRIDDKLSRLMRGIAAGEDVIKDLLGYLILLRIAQREQWNKQVHVAASPEVIEEVLAEQAEYAKRGADVDAVVATMVRDYNDLAQQYAAANDRVSELQRKLDEVGMPEGWSDPRQEPREDVGFALTDAEAAEAERAVDAEALTFAGPITCLICDKTFDDAEKLAAHLEDHNSVRRVAWLTAEVEVVRGRLALANQRLIRLEREKDEAEQSKMVAIGQIADHAKRRNDAEGEARLLAAGNERLVAENRKLQADMSLVQDQEATRTRSAVRSATLVLVDEVAALQKSTSLEEVVTITAERDAAKSDRAALVRLARQLAATPNLGERVHRLIVSLFETLPSALRDEVRGKP
jgi:hypothetical protein